jgi:hypothetical protein
VSAADEPHSALTQRLIADGLAPKAPTRSLSELLAEHRALSEALADAYRFISSPVRMETPKGGPKTATYRVENYNALTAKIRAVLERCDAPIAEPARRRSA